MHTSKAIFIISDSHQCCEAAELRNYIIIADMECICTQEVKKVVHLQYLFEAAWEIGYNAQVKLLANTSSEDVHLLDTVHFDWQCLLCALNRKSIYVSLRIQLQILTHIFFIIPCPNWSFTTLMLRSSINTIPQSIIRND